MSDNGPTADVDINRTLRDLMDVARVALGPDMPQAERGEAFGLLFNLLMVIDRTMPKGLQAQDPRVVAAKELSRRLTDG